MGYPEYGVFWSGQFLSFLSFLIIIHTPGLRCGLCFISCFLLLAFLCI